MVGTVILSRKSYWISLNEGLICVVLPTGSQHHAEPSINGGRLIGLTTFSGSFGSTLCRSSKLLGLFWAAFGRLLAVVKLSGIRFLKIPRTGSLEMIRAGYFGAAFGTLLGVVKLSEIHF